MNKKYFGFSKQTLDYEEDNYDRLKNTTSKNNTLKGFTKKITIKKKEYDYEEDSYEPEKNRG